MHKILLIILLLPVFTYSQKLENFFREYSLIETTPEQFKQKILTRERFIFNINSINYEFYLKFNDLLSKEYKSEATDLNTTYPMPKPEVFTYSGKLYESFLVDESRIIRSTIDGNSEVRFNIRNNEVEGIIFGDSVYFIEPASRFSKDSEYVNKLVAYTRRAIIKESGAICLTDMIDSKIDEIPPDDSSVSFTGVRRELEVATDADFSYTNSNGGASQTNTEIISILNIVDGIYERSLNLSVSVTYQHVWTSQDPFTGTDSGTILNNFRNYWNENFTNIHRDTAHLYTAKIQNQGVAFVGVVCVSPQSAYGLTAQSFSMAVKGVITAHEIGHNLNAEHVENSGDCANTVMNPSVSQTATEFCTISINQIINFINRYGSCISPIETTPTPTPIPTPIPTITPIPTPTLTPTPVPTPVLCNNIALGTTAIASSDSGAAYSPRLATDGNRTWGNGGGWRDGTQGVFPDWLQINFDENQSINRVDIYTVRDNYLDTSPVSANETFTIYGIVDFDVQYWSGSSWTTLAQIRGNNKVWIKIDFATIVTDKIRIHVLHGLSGFSRIVEVEVYNCSSVTPTPTPIPTVTPTPVPTVTPTPTPSERVNVALASNGGTATASSTSPGGYEPARAINGSRTWGGGGGWRDGTQGVFPDWLQVNFNGLKIINEISVYTVRDDYLSTAEPTMNETFSIYGITDFDIQYWNNSSWVTVPGGSIRNNNRVWVKVTFSSITMQQIRILIHNGQSGYSRVVEVEAWSGG